MANFNPITNPNPALGQLGSPEYSQGLYNWMEPNLQLGVDQSANQRGMFYSGGAADASMREKGNLLLELAKQQAEAQRQERLIQEEAARKQASDREAQNAQFKAAALQGGLGAVGVGGGLYAQAKMAQNAGLTPAMRAQQALNRTDQMGMAGDLGFKGSNLDAANVYKGVYENPSMWDAAGSDAALHTMAVNRSDAALPFAQRPMLGAMGQNSESFLGKASTPGNLGAGLIGGLAGSQIGGGGGALTQASAGMGGLGGYALGSQVGGSYAPLWAGLGALGGSMLGKQTGEGLKKLFKF